MFQLRTITSYWIGLFNDRNRKKFDILVLWTVIEGRVGYDGWTEFCYDWLKLTDVSVLGSQVFEQALMDSCEVL